MGGDMYIMYFCPFCGKQNNFYRRNISRDGSYFSTKIQVFPHSVSPTCEGRVTITHSPRISDISSTLPAFLLGRTITRLTRSHQQCRLHLSTSPSTSSPPPSSSPPGYPSNLKSSPRSKTAAQPSFNFAKSHSPPGSSSKMPS